MNKEIIDAILAIDKFSNEDEIINAVKTIWKEYNITADDFVNICVDNDSVSKVGRKIK